MTGTSSKVSVRRPKAICFDILGTASKSGFLERVLFPYLKVNLNDYLNKNWDQPDFVRLYKRVQDSSVAVNRTDSRAPIVLAHNAAQAKASLVNFINFCNDNTAIQSAPVTQLRFKVWFEGYRDKKLITPIYHDVSAGLTRWFAEGIKFYIYSNTWAEAQRAMLNNTTHGDLTKLISDYFDTDFGPLTESDSWRRFCAKIQEAPQNVLFLTKNVLEGRAADAAGLRVVLVLTHRHNVKAVSREDRRKFNYVRTLDDLQWSDGPASQSGRPVSSPSANSPSLPPLPPATIQGAGASQTQGLSSAAVSGQQQAAPDSQAASRSGSQAAPSTSASASASAEPTAKTA